MRGPRQNPFRPGLGKCPPLRVGYKEASRDLERMVDDILDGESGGFAQLPGPPGIGKTSLLAEHARVALDKGAVVRVVSGKGVEDSLGLARRIVKGDATVGGEIPRGGPWVWLLGLIRCLGSLVEPLVQDVLTVMADKAPTLLVVVDSQLIGPRALASLMSHSQMLFRDKPLALVISGSAGIGAVLRDTNLSYADRTRKIYLSGLEDGEVAEALSAPAANSGRPFDEDALALAVRESQGYPLFVQMLGAAAWQSAAESGEDRISLAAAQKGAAKARADKEAFLEERRAAFVEAGVLREAEVVSRALADAGEAGQVTERELDGLLKAEGVSDDRSRLEVLERMEDVGLIRSVFGGRIAWEPAVPGLSRHIAGHATE